MTLHTTIYAARKIITMNPSRPASIDQHKAVEQVKRYGVTNLFGSPAVILRLAELSDTEVSLPTVRRVISAGAPARAERRSRSPP